MLAARHSVEWVRCSRLVGKPASACTTAGMGVILPHHKELSTATAADMKGKRSSRDKAKGLPIKDARGPRLRVAKAKRDSYLEGRKAAFAEHQAKAENLGLDWTIRSGL